MSIGSRFLTLKLTSEPFSVIFCVFEPQAREFAHELDRLYVFAIAGESFYFVYMFGAQVYCLHLLKCKDIARLYFPGDLGL